MCDRTVEATEATAEGCRSGAQAAPSCPPVARLGASLALFLAEGNGEAPRYEIAPSRTGDSGWGLHVSQAEIHSLRKTTAVASGLITRCLTRKPPCVSANWAGIRSFRPRDRGRAVKGQAAFHRAALPMGNTFARQRLEPGRFLPQCSVCFLRSYIGAHGVPADRRPRDRDREPGDS
jgi:hypothetical protein